LLSDRRFVDLVVNLHYFEQRYGATLAQHDEQRDSLASVRGTRFRRVEELYYDYIHSQNTDVHSMLDRVSAMPRVSEQPADE
jgi:hypothetical protein